MSPITHALVLTAGLGTRLRPLTTVRAKPAIPVAGEPIARRIVRWLAGHGVRDIVLNLHHLPQTLTRVIGDGADLAARVRYSWEQPVVLGSAGGPRQALPIVGVDTFFLVNGDTLTDVDLESVAAAHHRASALVTLALVPNTRFERYGGVLLDPDGIVAGFVSRGAAARGSFHLIGVQAVCADAFASLSSGVPARSIGGVYDELIRSRPGSVRGFVCDARFFDIGTVADYWHTSLALGTEPLPQTIVWDDVQIEEGSTVDQCIVTDGVRVGSGCVYRRQILLRGPDGAIVVEPLALGDDDR
ncbi:MAG: NTP transferase domain-containing protein [Luteitalea sp.]|nr:NTP transferase domain-containing protein [Luteitalea sp.]